MLGVGEVVPSVLVVEDDPAVRELLAENLAADRFDVATAASVREALAHLRQGRPDAALVDLALPDGGGLDLIAAIRDGGADEPWDAGMPIVIVSGSGDAHAVVRGLDRGADDYLTKPFDYTILNARLRAVLRRSLGATVRNELRVGSLVVDRHGRRALLHGRVVPLAAKEFALLAMLARDPRRVFTKRELLRDVWGFRGAARTRTVDSHASRLRRKLARQGADRLVVNVWGVGYRLLPEDA